MKVINTVGLNAFGQIPIKLGQFSYIFTSIISPPMSLSF